MRWAVVRREEAHDADETSKPEQQVAYNEYEPSVHVV
jgi:hypothetical protein